MRSRSRYMRLIRSLAYDAKLFERCIALIIRIIDSEDSENGREEGKRTFASLFPIYFSGTYATIDQRLGVITKLLVSEDERRRMLGLAALKAALEAVHFGPGWDFEFGAHSRDYGWWPRTREEYQGWFAKGVALAGELGFSDYRVAPDVLNVLAEQFRGLWGQAGMYSELEGICKAVSMKRFWREGWIAVRQTIHFDSKGFTADVSARLGTLEELLRPKETRQNPGNSPIWWTIRCRRGRSGRRNERYSIF